MPENSREKQRSKAMYAIVILAVILIAFFFYQFVVFPQSEKSMLLGWMGSMQRSSGSSIEKSEAKLAELESNITVNSEVCRAGGKCDVNETISGLNLYSLQKSSRYFLDAPKITIDWHRSIANQNAGTGCGAVAKYPALILSEMMAVSDMGRGYVELTNRQHKDLGRLTEEIIATNPGDNAADIDDVTNKYSEARKNLLKSYIDEVSGNYSASKDARISELSGMTAGAFRSQLDDYQKWSGGNKVPLPVICSGSVHPQVVSYQKGFIEYSYGQLTSLAAAEKYDEAIPFANIIYGFVSSPKDKNLFGIAIK